MEKVVLFWILLGVVGFAFALAVQMRVMIALVLRRALSAWRPVFEDRELANRAVVQAAAPVPATPIDKGDLFDAIEHLREVYPNPLRHLRLARRYSVVTPVVLLALIAAGRTILGVL